MVMCSLARPPVCQASPGRARNVADAVPALDRYPSPLSGTAVSRAGSSSCVRLAVSGWSIRCHVQPDGRTVIEVSDETGVLTGLVAGTRLPILSADAGWRGTTRGAGGARRWWALAIGHVPDGAGRPAVTFTRRRPGSRRPHRTTVRPATMGGLWVAAVIGRFTTVRCQLTSAEPALLTAVAPPARRLAPVTAWYAASVRMRTTPRPPALGRRCICREFARWVRSQEWQAIQVATGDHQVPGMRRTPRLLLSQPSRPGRPGRRVTVGAESGARSPSR
jgi:hypothetical protein